MGYVTNRDGRWYAVSYEGLEPLTGRSPPMAPRTDT